MIREKVYLYLRLSVEEDGSDESTSISNQRKILHQYAQQHNLEVVGEYVDDGVSGYTMNRRGFNKLKQDLNSGKVQTILAKDFSRIGRHNAKVQLFLEKILETGKRAIIPGDNYDTLDETTHVMVGAKTWVNEIYVKDTSRKVRDSLSVLQQEGKLLCNVPYGYYKDPYDKNKCYVDHAIAPYIEKIFNMYINGKGVKEIARMLTEENVPTPTMVKKQRKEANGQVCKIKVSGIWDTSVIIRILKNEFYLGTLVLHKTKTRSIRGKKVDIDPEEYLKFPGHHEAIIDKHTFALAQEIRASRKVNHFRGIKSKVRKNLFAGIIYCADCGSLLTTSGYTSNTRYICKTYNVFGTSKCSSHVIMENDIIEALTDLLEHCKTGLQDVLDDLNNIIAAKLKHNKDKENVLYDLTRQLESARKSVETLIQMKLMEIRKNPTMADMIDETYSKMQNDKYAEIRMLEQQINSHKVTNLNEQQMRSDINIAMTLINEIIDSKDLTKKQILMIVDKVVVYEDGGMDIYLKGDLHKLTSNYFRISHSQINQIKQHIFDYIKINQINFSKTGCTAYVIDKGIKVTYKSISKIIKEDLYDMVEYMPREHGYKITVSISDIEAVLAPNIVVGATERFGDNSVINSKGIDSDNIIMSAAESLHNNNVDFDLVCNICNWAHSTVHSNKDVF